MTLVVVEGAMTAMLSFPEVLPQRLLSRLREYYMTHDRRLVQYVPEWARYDAQLAYTLKPCTFRAKGREFDVVFEVNSLGVRDDEASLRAPQVVVDGDSHAMGWGVGQEQTFAQVLEREAGVRVLNAAVSSFGTAREMALLGRVDLSRLEVLVIQYCPNDYVENKGYWYFGRRLPISSEAEYMETVDQHMRDTDYYFGKHTAWLVGQVARGLASKQPQRPAGVPPAKMAEDEATAFVYVMANCGLDLEGVRVIVIEISSRGDNDSRFIDALRRTLAKGDLPRFVRAIRAVDLSGGLTPERYFLLDDHMTAAGHAFVAEQLLPLLGEAAD